MTEDGLSAAMRSSEDTVKQLQAYLRKYENDDKLVILEALETPGSKPGDNYTSEMIRTKFVGICGDGSPYVKSFMTKGIVQDSRIFKVIDISHLFRTEAHVYSEILSILPSFSPRCLYADYCTIIMEDLAERGYVNCERRNFMDLDHTTFVLKKLAKLHASALAIKINNPQQFDTLTMHLEEINDDNFEMSVMKLITGSSMRSMLQLLDAIQSQTQELKTVRDHIATCADKLYDAIYRLFTAPKQKYDTICHGDPWSNNLLFSHGNDGRVVDLKMVDYQLSKHISISADILYFIYSSVQSSLIERSFESLIKIYHNEFLSELRQSHADEKILKELTMEWLNKELRTYAFYGLLIGCFFTIPMLAEDEDVQQFKSTNFSLPNLQDNVNPNGKKILDRVKCLALHYYKRLYLGGINDDIEPIPITG